MGHRRPKRSIGAKVTIDGYDLCWTLHSEPRWCTDGYKGLGISVRLSEGPAARELRLEYPYPKWKPGARHSERPRVVPSVIEAGIRAAMAAGWNPHSRGRIFSFQVPEE